MAIFSHEYGMEPNVDHLEVLAPEGRNILRFLQQSPGDVGDVSTECTLDRGAVERLYSALGEWLYPTGVRPVGDLTTLGEALSKGFAEMATAVQSLHLSPVAVVKVPQVAGAVGIDCNALLRPGHRLADVCNNCGFTWALHRVQPEPEPLCLRTRPLEHHAASRCTWCGHLWTEHPVAEPEPQHETASEAADRWHGRLMDSILPRRVKTECLNCEHPQSLHGPLNCASLTYSNGASTPCRCNWGPK